MNISDSFVGSRSPKSAEQFYQARLVRIAHGVFAIWLDPFGMLVHEVAIASGAIHVTYDPLQTTEKKIEESIRASGNRVTSATTDSETLRPGTGPGLAATREPPASE